MHPEREDSEDRENSEAPLQADVRGVPAFTYACIYACVHACMNAVYACWRDT